MHRTTCGLLGFCVLVLSLPVRASADAETPAEAVSDPVDTSAQPSAEPLAPAPPAADVPPPTAPDVPPAVAPPRRVVLDDELPREPPPRRKGKKGLLITGLAIFGGSYLFSVLVGLTLLAQEGEGETPEQTCSNCDKGNLLAIPLFGPWLMLPHADGADGKAVSTILGLAQGTGAILLIAGIVKFTRSSRSHAAGIDAPKLALRIDPVASGAHASLRMRF